MYQLLNDCDMHGGQSTHYPSTRRRRRRLPPANANAHAIPGHNQHFIYNEQAFAILLTSLELCALLTDVIYHK